MGRGREVGIMYPHVHPLISKRFVNIILAGWEFDSVFKIYVFITAPFFQ